MDKRRALLLGLNIGIVATSLLAAFFTSTLLLSVVGLRVQPGTPSWSLEGESLRLSVPLQLMNAGPRDVENLSIESSVKSGAHELGRGATGPITVKAGEGRTLTHTITVPLRGIPENVLRGLLLEDQSLDVQLRAGLGFTPLAQVQVLASLSLPWGAPLGNLQVGRPEIQPLNATHIRLSVPFSFTNRSPYVDIDATVRIMVLDEAGRLLGQGFLTLRAPRSTPFSGRVPIIMSLGRDLSTLLFEDAALRYNVRFELSSAGLPGFSFTQPVTIDWKAPLHNLQVGPLTLRPLNATSVRFEAAISFENRSPYVDIATRVLVDILDPNNRVVGGGAIDVKAPRQSRFSGVVEGAVRVEGLDQLLFNDATLRYTLRLRGVVSGFTFILDRPVTIEWRAPLSGLSLSANATHIALGVQVSFTNRSPFMDVESSVMIRVLNQTTGGQLGLGVLRVSAPRQTAFQGEAILYLELSRLPLDKLIFEDRQLTLRLSVEGRVSEIGFTLTRDVQVAWRAPISNLQVGRVTATPISPTQTRLSIPLNFTNNSPILALRGQIIVEVINADGLSLGTSAPVPLDLPPGAAFQRTLELTVDPRHLTSTITIRLVFQLEQGTFTHTLVVRVA